MGTSSSYLFLIPLLPILGAAINLLFARRIPRAATHAVAVAAVLGAFVVVLWQVAGPLLAEYHHWHEGDQSKPLGGLAQVVYQWIHVGGLKVDLAFRLDTLSAVMVMIITGVGTLIHIYSIGYMHDDPRYAAYFGYLNLFTGAMLILVLGDNLLVMFIGWEGVGLCSYLLIGFWFTNEAYANAGRKAFIVNRIGDFAFLLGVCLLFYTTSTVSFPELAQEQALTALRADFMGMERTAFFACVLLFIGACGKSAQIPLYVWLPDAMAGPTPVSALIHAATMVTAGVYMIARLSAVYAQSATAMAVVAAVGAATALFAAIMAFAQTDLKKVLAYSTISQLGFMFVGVGVGAFSAGVFHLMTHAFFKAGLFLGAGSVMHAMSGSGDITKMGGLREKTKITHATFLVFCLAIAGFPFFAGFFSKDEILAGAAAAQFPEGFLQSYGRIIWGVLTITALCTAFYMFRLYCLVFSGHCRADEETRAHIHESPATMTVPLIILAVLSFGAGWLGMPHIWGPNFFEHWLSASLVNPKVAMLQANPLPGGAQWLLMGVAVVAGLSGISLAVMLYRRGPSAWVKRVTENGFPAALRQVVADKFYVDEFYHAVIVRPFRWLAMTLFEVVDRFLIDLVIVNGSAFVVDVTGRVVRWFQNGQVQRYLVALLVGAAALFFFASRPTVDFTYQPLESGVVRFAAELGGGPAAAGASIEWDFNGDGRPDSTEREATWNFSRPGEYEVVLRYKEPIFRREREVSKKIVVPTEAAAAAAPAGPAAGTRGGAR